MFDIYFICPDSIRKSASVVSFTTLSQITPCQNIHPIPQFTILLVNTELESEAAWIDLQCIASDPTLSHYCNYYFCWNISTHMTLQNDARLNASTIYTVRCYLSKDNVWFFHGNTSRDIELCLANMGRTRAVHCAKPKPQMRCARRWCWMLENVKQADQFFSHSIPCISSVLSSLWEVSVGFW